MKKKDFLKNIFFSFKIRFPQMKIFLFIWGILPCSKIMFYRGTLKFQLFPLQISILRKFHPLLVPKFSDGMPLSLSDY